MNFKTLVSENLPEIKKLLFAEESSAPYLDAKLVDGSIVRISPVMEMGATVSLIGEDGSEVAIPDDSHELQDGTIMRTEGGMIVEIIEAPVVEEVEAPAVEEVMESAKVKDSEVVLNADPDFSVGAMVTIEGDEAVAEGTYTLEDGRVCVVEAGVITEITEAPEEEAVEEVVTEEAMRVAMAKYVKKMGFATEGKFNERFAEMEKGITLLTEIVAKLSALPKEEAKKPVSNPFNRNTTDVDLVERMRKALKESK
tara:strand:+ start:1588 stop:2349 length:762 start_codon:yes stop_codon:yes gene_type:complete